VRNYGKPICRWEAHLIPNPIRKVLSSMRAHRVRALLMGGQACVFYGAAEFSHDMPLKKELEKLRHAKIKSSRRRKNSCD
jgi:hypothetical protein